MLKISFLIILLLLLSILSLFVGVGSLTVQGLLAGDVYQWQLLTVSRLPRLISILIAGMGLSICGMILQYLSRNRFVSPTTAGLTDSAQFGVLMSIFLFPAGAPVWGQISIAILFTFLGSLIFMAILKSLKHREIVFVPLVGMMLGSIISAITIFFALQFDLLQSLSGWLHGDFSTILAGRYETLYLSIPALIVIYLYANHFILVGMGENFAVNLGLNYQKILYLGLILVSFITAIVVVTVGVLPFLGLIVPNIVAIYFGDNLKRNLSYVALLGAILVLICDILGRVIIFPYEITVSLIMGVIGSAIFLWLLIRKQYYGK